MVRVKRIPISKATHTMIANIAAMRSRANPSRPVHIPIEVQRAMAQKVQKAALPEGDRALPQAGLIFFLYRGKVKSIHSMELIYHGPAGEATLNLQP